MNHIDESDQEFTESKIKEVGMKTEDGFLLAFEDGFSMFVSNPEGLPPPEPGSVARLYGKGFGCIVRGFAVPPNVYYYETAQEFEARMAKERAEQITKQKKEWEEKLPVFMEKLDKLPAPFQERIRYFMQDEDWGWKFGPYEMFCCEEAVKIAQHCGTEEAIKVFYEKPWEEQAVVVDDGHSGNTFGTACRLAVLYLNEPDLLRKMHGALCPLVGCDEYGCWSSTEEAKAERAEREQKEREEAGIKIQSHITFCGQDAVLSCDGKCNKAWGMNCRKVKADFGDDKDPIYFGDDELDEAPVLPGTWEGQDTKPADHKHNKWCARECERSRLTQPGEKIVLPVFNGEEV